MKSVVFIQRITAMLLALTMLVACGGDGGGGGGPSTQPAIIGQPADQNVVVGTTATFTVVASNVTGYQWQLSVDDGATFSDIAGATSVSYTTAATTLADNGKRYRAIVSGAGGSLTSSIASLTVSTLVGAPQITVQPIGERVTEPEPARFSVTATGTNLAYQWQICIDVNDSCDWTDVVGANQATYTIDPTAESMNQQRYRVVVSNTLASVQSDEVLLIVDPMPQVPVITSQPVSVSVLAPDAAIFSVAYSGVPEPVPHWQYSNNGTDWYDLGVTSSVYALSPTSVGDDGRQFRVVVENSAGSVTSQVATLTISGVQSAPSFITQPASVTLDEGDFAHFHVATSGVPSATLQWQVSFDGGAYWGNITGETGDTFTIRGVIKDRSGWQYRAVASNRLGSVTSNVATLTVSKGWSVPVAMSRDQPGEASNPKIAVDASGNAIAVWEQAAGARHDIWARRFTPGNGWGSAVALESNLVDTAIAPDIAMDPAGNALVVWSQFDGTRYNIWSNYYRPASGWGGPVLIETDIGSADDVRVAMDGSGRGVAVWRQLNSSQFWDVRAARFSSEGWWGPAFIVENAATETSGAVVAMNAEGKAVVAWNRYDPNQPAGVWARPYDVATDTWGIKYPVASGSSSGWDIDPELAVDPAGRALVVWRHYDTSADTFNLQAVRFSGTDWGVVQSVETTVGRSDKHHLATDSSGNITLVWDRTTVVNGRSYTQVWVSHAIPQNLSWSTPVLLELAAGAYDNYASTAPWVTFAPSGKAFAVWADFGGVVPVATYSPSDGWSQPRAMVLSTVQAPGSPSVVFDNTGHGFAIWRQADSSPTGNGIYAIWVSRFQ